jgi:phospholipid/cholesterol/gamma-HCH transport system substrate-binding protein
MRMLTRAITLAALATAAGAVGVWTYGQVTPRPAGEAFRSWVLFRDASGLPPGARVMIAGVHVGEIAGLAVEGQLARVELRLRDDLEVWDDAWVEKRADGMFGSSYLEIHPGGPGFARRRLASGERIPRVVEAASADRVIRSLDQAMPRAAGALQDFDRVVTSARRTIAGPATARLEEVVRRTGDPELLAGLRRVSEGLERFDRWAAGVQRDTDGLAPEVRAALDEAAATLGGYAVDLRDGRDQLQRRLQDARAGLDRVDPYLADATEVVARLDGRGPPGDRGRLAELVNDPTPGDDLATLSDDAATAAGSLSRLEAIVGLRSEYNVLARDVRYYLSAEVEGRLGTYYLLELEKSQLGGLPELTLEDRPGDGAVVRRATVRERLRYTAQAGLRFAGGLGVRLGLKESTPGAGVDARLMGGRLELALDAFGPSLSAVPRLKLTAALEVFEQLYVVAGVDDVLTDGGELAVAPWPDDDDVPIQFRGLRYGRDAFLGAMLRFDDEDLARMLAVYGGVIFALL